MFKATRNKLTFIFSGLIIVFLIGFNGISYWALSTMIYKDSEKNIQLLADLEFNDHAKDLLKLDTERIKKDSDAKKEHDSDKEHDHEDDIPVAERTMLRPSYYVLNANGTVVDGEHLNRAANTDVVQFLQTWVPSSHVKYEKFSSRSGDEVHLVFAGRPVYTEDGVYRGAIYTGADISQQAEIFRKLLFILSVLSAVFFVVSVFLGYVMSGRAMGPIFRSFHRQQQFVADASHELRTPISVIQSSLDVIEAEEGETMQPFSKQVLNDLKDEVRRMSSLLKDLLTLARADVDEMKLQYDTFSLKDEMERMIRKLQPLADEKQQSLTLGAAPEMTIRADRERLQQLMIILLDNAMQYTPEHGSIKMAAQLQGHAISLSVTDTGIGIPKDKQKDIFERFYRGDTARSRNQGNVGLGLSIAKWIAEAHGGAIQVKSEPGQGSTFTVTIPVR